MHPDTLSPQHEQNILGNNFQPLADFFVGFFFAHRQRPIKNTCHSDKSVYPVNTLLKWEKFSSSEVNPYFSKAAELYKGRKYVLCA